VEQFFSTGEAHAPPVRVLNSPVKMPCPGGSFKTPYGAPPTTDPFRRLCCSAVQALCSSDDARGQTDTQHNTPISCGVGAD